MIAAVIATGYRLVAGTRVQWRCDPDSTSQRIYFANHSSHLDFVAIWSAIPSASRARTRPVAARDYWQRNRLSRYLASEVFRAVLVERRDAESGSTCESAARATVEYMAREMGAHDSLIVFPEGTRSATGDLGPFKSGLYHLSRLQRWAELIPVHLENLNRILPKGEALPVPMLSRVVFGPPFRTAVDDKESFLAGAREAVLELRGRPEGRPLPDGAAGRRLSERA
jgi:1-acyl-sn-glycerol-3-phosphate acyltransferase